MQLGKIAGIVDFDGFMQVGHAFGHAFVAFETLISSNLISKALQLVLRNKLHATSVRSPAGRDGSLR